MVVVNDAEEMVGRRGVEVVVLSTRPTNQGLLVFARIADDVSLLRAEATKAPTNPPRPGHPKLAEPGQG